LGETLQTLREFTLDFDSETKGMSISNSNIIRDAHNSFARPEPIVLQSRAARSKDDDLFHFVAYVPRDGKVFELDGLQRGPINHGDFGDRHWLDVAIPAIQRKIGSFALNEIKFNLMAVTKDPRVTISQRLSELQASRAGSEHEIARLKHELDLEESKVAEWRNENIRRRHNYIPFVFALLKEVAAAKKLTQALELAKSHTEVRQT
jgi:ubiquitin carboxyl-terminal hydrolase L5